MLSRSTSPNSTRRTLTQSNGSPDECSKRLSESNSTTELPSSFRRWSRIRSYDPLAWGPENRAFIEERVEDEDPRLLDRIERALSTYAYESGARTKAERELAKRAEAILLALSPAERDRLGFASKNAAKLQVLAPHLEGESSNKAERLAKEVARLEEERFGLPREERYATAARHLQASGMTRAEVSRRLCISNSIVERIVATHRRDVELTSDDPIRVDLAPGLF